MRRLILAAAAAAALSGCSGDRTFNADELVGELNDEGAGLVLGDPLSTADQGAELRALSFEDSAAAGALTILEGSDQAREELARCESAISFVCYRVANGVLRFDGASPTDQTKLSLAMMALEEG